jgi:hypothetical protein
MKTLNQETETDQKKIIAELVVIRGMMIGVYITLFLFFLLHWCVFWAKLD